MYAEIIPLKTVTNCRDLGTICNKDGYYIKKNMLLRSGGFYNGEKDLEDLVKLYDEHNLRHIIDLRSKQEKIENPDPQYKDIKYFDLVVQENSNVAIQQDEQSLRQRREYFENLRLKCNESDEYAKNHMCGFYRKTIESDYTIKAYKRFLDYLLTAEGACLWHCALGRDRTGIAALLVLSLLDVNKEDIYDDYLYSNNYLYRPSDISEYYATAHVEYVNTIYDTINEKFGNIDKMFAYMGVDHLYKERFKKKFLMGY